MRNIVETRSNAPDGALPEAQLPEAQLPEVPPFAQEPVTQESAPRAAASPADRLSLQRELLEEFAAWPSRDRGGAFRQWHRHALSLIHLHVLSMLEAEGALSMRRLAEGMDVSDASATGIVDRMEKRGLVERRHGTDDRRMVLVRSTDAGGRVFDDMLARRRALLSTVLDQLSDEEIGALLFGIKAMAAARGRVMSSAPDDDAAPAAPPAAPPQPATE
jgi:DNA-binding MarR family transcriptional regulator